MAQSLELDLAHVDPRRTIPERSPGVGQGLAMDHHSHAALCYHPTRDNVAVCLGNREFDFVVVVVVVVFCVAFCFVVPGARLLPEHAERGAKRGG